MPSAIVQAIKQICEEKNIPYESVFTTIEAALAAAYRKDFGDKNQNIKVEFNAETGESHAFDIKIVVADELAEAYQKEMDERQKMRDAGIEPPPIAAVGHQPSAVGGERKAEGGGPEALSGEQAEPEEPRFHPKLNISLTEAKKIKQDAELGETLIQELAIPGAFGRMAAQTAKQVIMQKLREVEREVVFNEFKSREGQVITATVQRREGRVVLIDLGKATGVILPEDQIEIERYIPGQRIKVYVKSVGLTTKGPEILLSRVSKEIVRRLFETEIPEIASGVVELKIIAREAGARSKVAVNSLEENVDPIGSCIGQRGSRIQTIISELGGEKIDVISWDEDPAVLIANALSPAKVKEVKLNEGTKTATVIVHADQLSLAIGRGGQNVRLAAELTGWKIDVVEEIPSVKIEEAAPAAADEETVEEAAANEPVEEKQEDATLEKEGVAVSESEVEKE
ncbi:MAG: transcription termination factor NusA [Patescibacteria group bacterium]